MCVCVRACARQLVCVCEGARAHVCVHVRVFECAAEKDLRVGVLALPRLELLEGGCALRHSLQIDASEPSSARDEPTSGNRLARHGPPAPPAPPPWKVLSSRPLCFQSIRFSLTPSSHLYHAPSLTSSHSILPPVSHFFPSIYVYYPSTPLPAPIPIPPFSLSFTFHLPFHPFRLSPTFLRPAKEGVKATVQGTGGGGGEEEKKEEEEKREKE